MYGFGELKIVANICMGKIPLPNGINSGFKKQKNMHFFPLEYSLEFWTLASEILYGGSK